MSNLRLWTPTELAWISAMLERYGNRQGDAAKALEEHVALALKGTIEELDAARIGRFLDR